MLSPVGRKKYFELSVTDILSLNDMFKTISTQQFARSIKFTLITRQRVLHDLWHDEPGLQRVLRVFSCAPKSHGYAFFL